MEEFRYGELLRALGAHQVDFIIVGMVAAVLQGAPFVTFDLDIVHLRTPENVARLIAALRAVSAVYRMDPRKLSPSESHLIGPGHQLLETSHGRLDCLGTIDGERTYDDLLAHSVHVDLSDGATVQVVHLRELIEIKRRAGRPKDLAVIPTLESTLDEIEGRP